MHKAQKELRRVIPSIDVLIEVLDARIPFSSENPLIGEICGKKPCIKILNKMDLADDKVVRLWQEFYGQKRGVKTLLLEKTSKNKREDIVALCEKLAPEKTKSVKRLRTMIVGIPNVGKSTLINDLLGKVLVKTGDEPAITKRQQDVKLNENILLVDTPGILWPKQALFQSAYRLAATGAIKSTAMEFDDVAFFLAEYMLQHYPERLTDRYDLTDLPDDVVMFFEFVGTKRGALARGGRVDLNKISELFVNDFRGGLFGGVCLETPNLVESEFTELQNENKNKISKTKKAKR